MKDHAPEMQAAPWKEQKKSMERARISKVTNGWILEEGDIYQDGKRGPTYVFTSSVMLAAFIEQNFSP